MSRKLGRKTRTDVTDVDSRGGSVSGRSRTGRGRGIGALGRRHDSQGAMRERHGRGLLTRTRALVMQNIVGRFARTQSQKLVVLRSAQRTFTSPGPWPLNAVVL